MDHDDHVALLRAGVPDGPATWADLGAGEGAFTLALAELLGPGATIHILDREWRALDVNIRRMGESFPQTVAVAHRADFVDGVPFPSASLDGIVMANSLHFVKDKAPVLRRLVTSLRPGGRFLLVEYGSDRGNPWVPWPLSFRTWEGLAGEVGLTATRPIGEVPSRFLGSIYSASSEAAVLSSPPHGTDREE